jgi:hypothetical protein
VELGRLTTLQELCLENCAWVTDAGLRELEGLRSLESLDLSGTNASDAGMTHAAQLPHLVGLHLRDCAAVTDAGLQHLARSTSLQSLTLSGTHLSRAAVRSFLRGRPRTDLRTNVLDVADLQPLVDAGAQITLDGRYEVSTIVWDGSGQAGAVQIIQPGLPPPTPDRVPIVAARSAGPPSREALALLTDCWAMHVLVVRELTLTDAALASLAEASALQRLDLDNCPIRGDGLHHLRTHGDLRYLRIRSPVLTDEGLRQLGRLTQLQHLSLERPLERDGTAKVSEVSVTDEGLQHLQGLVNLQSLHLVGLPLTGAGLEHLQALPRLSSLTLRLDTLDQESFRHIARLPCLARLSLVGPVTAGGIRHLSSAANLSGLALQGTTLDAGAARELAVLPKLTSLELVDANLSGAALRIVATAPRLGSLRLVRADCRDIDLQEIRSSRPALHVSVEDER